MCVCVPCPRVQVHIDDLQLPPEERDLANLQLKVAEQTEEIRSLKALLVNKDTELSSLRASVQSQRRALRDANRRLKHGEKSRKLSGVSEEEKEALANVILARSEKREQERLLRESIENTEKGRNSCGIENRTFFAGKDDRKANRGGKKGQKEREIAWYKDVLKLCVTANSDPAQQQEKEKLLTAARERVKACLSEAEHAKLLEDIGMPSETDRKLNYKQDRAWRGTIPLDSHLLNLFYDPLFIIYLIVCYPYFCSLALARPKHGDYWAHSATAECQPQLRSLVLRSQCSSFYFPFFSFSSPCFFHISI